MAFLGDRPRPWVLAIDVTDEEVDVIAPYSGHLVSTTSDSIGVNLREFDVVIATNAQYHAYSDVPFGLKFGPPAVDEERGYVVSSGGSALSVLGQTRSRSYIRRIPAQTLELTEYTNTRGLRSLVENSCYPGPGNPYQILSTPVYPERDVHVLLREPIDPSISLAAVLERRDELGTLRGSDYWLPDMARRHLKSWLEVAIAEWRNHLPDSFPVSAEWETQTAWLSAEERTAARALTDFDRVEKLRRDEVALRRLPLVGAAEEAAIAGETARRLLKEDGDDLVEAVKTALSDLGFSVVDSDALPANKSAKNEDLQVLSNDGWVALAEVKGYTKGAKANDLDQVTRTAATYAARTSSLPDVLWYIVNGYRTTDPTARPTPLQSDPERLATFAEIHSGCLIDTRELYRLVQAVKSGQLDAEYARDRLIASKERFQFDETS